MTQKEIKKAIGTSVKNSPKKHKNHIKNSIKKQKIALLRSIKRITMFVALQCAATIPQAGNTLLGSNDEPTIPNKNLLAEAHAVNSLDVKKQVLERVEWIVKDNFIPAAKKHLENVLHKKGTTKSKYIKKEFFDIVYPRGGRPGTDNYCIAALMRCMMDANEAAGDLTAFIPDRNTTDGHNNISCPRFLAYAKHNFPDCVSRFQRQIDITSLEEGDILIVNSAENTSSGLHAKMYVGEGKILSFNNDYIKDAQNVGAGYVIKTSQIAQKCVNANINGLNPQETIQVLTSGRDGLNRHVSSEDISQAIMNSGRTL